MFTEDKIKQVIQDNNIKECNANYIVQFDAFGNAIVSEEKNTIIGQLNEYKTKLDKLEKEFEEIGELDSKVDELEMEIDSVKDQMNLV